MNTLIQNLRSAKQQHLLINIYQRDSEDFYTGYVQMVGDDGVVVATYNDAGLADGAALITYEAIDSIEIGGPDIDSMEFRIAAATKEDFRALPAAPLALPLNNESPVAYQVAENMRRTGQVVMVIAFDIENYLEGQITAVTTDSFTMDVINKFNYTDVRSIQVDFANLGVLEYDGYDLFLASAMAAKRDSLRHVTTVRHLNTGNMAEVLSDARDEESLIAIVGRQSMDQFYVGRVAAVNETFVVLSLVDMGGQFGGYTLLRLRGIHSVIVASDYLQSMTMYETWGQTHHFVQVPKLNRERVFDASDDLLGNLVGEGEVFGRVFRLRTAMTKETLIGTPTNVTNEGFDWLPFGDPQAETQHFKMVQVLALSFGSVYSYLQEQWVQDNSEE